MGYSGLIWPTRRLALAALGMGASGALLAMSLVVENGEITGVQDITIHGQRYDLTFTDGTFNGLYPSGSRGYGDLAEALAQAVTSASASGALAEASQGQAGGTLRGCLSATSCTILIPSRTAGAAPQAQRVDARELIYQSGRFTSVSAELWPFDAATETKYMPDMLYAIIREAR